MPYLINLHFCLFRNAVLIPNFLFHFLRLHVQLALPSSSTPCFIPATGSITPSLYPNSSLFRCRHALLNETADCFCSDVAEDSNLWAPNFTKTGGHSSTASATHDILGLWISAKTLREPFPSYDSSNARPCHIIFIHPEVRCSCIPSANSRSHNRSWRIRLC